MAVIFKRSILWLMAVILSPLTAFAENPEVLPGRFVIESYQSRSAEASILKSYNLNTVKILGRGNTLVSVASMSRSASRLEPYDAARDICPELIASGAVRACSPDFVLKTTAVPNDPELSQVWGLSAPAGINATGAWDISTGSENIIVAVIDTGIDYNHPDLRANMWFNPAEIPGNGIDDDNNGYIDDVHGINASGSGPRGDPLDEHGHGSHIAGVIGASSNNGLGVAGINWNVKLMALKFMGSTGVGSISGAVEAINYMTSMKEKGFNLIVSNNSWGGGGYSQPLLNAIEASTRAGVIFVTAAGNTAADNDLNPSYPANYELNDLLSVASIDQRLHLSSFSNTGSTTVDIAAPGTRILSTYAGGGYEYLSGTSMAAAHVSGTLALASSVFNENSTSLIKRLYESGRPESSLTGLVRTSRIVDAYRLLSNIRSPVTVSETELGCGYLTGNASKVSPATEGSLLLKADEFQFTRFVLPFSFPFHRNSYSEFFISPNGVIYFERPPAGQDYQVGEIAPINSIAALHADLSTSDPGLGVFGHIEKDRFQITWKATAFKNQETGIINIVLTLYRSGVIEVNIDGSQHALNALAGENLIGLTGPSRYVTTVATGKGSSIAPGTAIRFVPECELDPPVVNHLAIRQLSRIKRKAAFSRKIIPGKKSRIVLSGTGSGIVKLGMAINNASCPDDLNISFSGGQGQTEILIPRKIERAQKMVFKVIHSDGTLRKRVHIKNMGTRNERLSKRAIKRLCGKIQG